MLLAEAAEPGARVLVVMQRHGTLAESNPPLRRKAEGRPVKHKAARRPPRLMSLIIGPGVPAAVPEAVAPLRETVGAAVEVVLRNGRVLQVGGKADVATIARLAAALEE